MKNNLDWQRKEIVNIFNVEIQQKTDLTNLRFVDAMAILNHSLIRIGFREYWESMISEDKRSLFFEHLLLEINQIIGSNKEFVMTIPMLYLEFEKGPQL